MDMGLFLKKNRACRVANISLSFVYIYIYIYIDRHRPDQQRVKALFQTTDWQGELCKRRRKAHSFARCSLGRDLGVSLACQSISAVSS